MVKITGNTFPVKEQLRALGGKWNGAEKCWELPDAKADEARALVGPTPIYNSPPPVDLGTTDPVALAARFGRTAVAGAEVVSFGCYGLPKGSDPTPTARSNGARTRASEPAMCRSGIPADATTRPTCSKISTCSARSRAAVSVGRRRGRGQ